MRTASHTHFRTHPKPASVGQAGRWQGVYRGVMIDHDKNVDTVLEKTDDLGIAENTIVFYITDNGPHTKTWPDCSTMPFRSEKNANWEGAYRVPAMVRWLRKIKPGAVSNNIISHMDCMTTLLAAAGTGARHMGLVHHDDAEREYAYHRSSSVGPLSTRQGIRWSQGERLDSCRHV